MTQEEKQLLLKDLCPRLPYGVICDMWFERNEAGKITEVLKCGGLMRLMNQEFDFVAKPYLRPMSSMTEEEQKEFGNLVGLWKDARCDGHFINRIPNLSGEFAKTLISEIIVAKAIDWLNKNMFDYRGLIPMGLALEASEGIYKTE